MKYLESSELKYFFANIMSKILFFWVKARPLPANPQSELGLRDAESVLYILPTKSFADFLVLFYNCKKLGLPVPSSGKLDFQNSANYISLNRSLPKAIAKKEEELPTPIQKLVLKLKNEENFNIQIVPVSIFWGRNPGKDEKSLFKLLFADEQYAGVLQKFFIVLAQGRDTFIHFGQPIFVRENIDEEKDAIQTARKLQRVLRVHFRSQRIKTLGPKYYDRDRVVSNLFYSRNVQKAIEAEVKKSGANRDKVEAKTLRYLNEIAAAQTYSAIRFFGIVLGYVLNKIFAKVEIINANSLREIPENHELVYVPAHRSYFDFLILPYELYYHGISTPHFAAGVNLNIWLVGGLLRRAGAFFIRRSFKGNYLYKEIFFEYLGFLMTKGHSISYFPEAKRSRTGRTLQPKTGMLSMIVQTYLSRRDRPIAFVPVYIGYDNIVEIKSYIKELSGQEKKPESFSQLVKARKVLKKKFGKAYVSIGKTVLLNSYLDEKVPAWSNDLVDTDKKPAWFPSFVDGLAFEINSRINSAAVISPHSILGLALLSTSQKAFPEDDLLWLVDSLLKIARRNPFTSEVTVPSMSAKELLMECESFSLVKRFRYPGSDVIHLGELEGVLISYYRNNIMHLFAMPSLIASYFQFNDEFSIEEIVAGCKEIYPFLQKEFFLPHSSDFASDILKSIAALVDTKILSYTDDTRTRLSRPSPSSNEFSVLKILGRVLGGVFERYSISAIILEDDVDKEPVSSAKYEEHCQLLAQRICILNGITDPEYYDRNLFSSHFGTLREFGFLHPTGDEDLVKVDKKIKDLFDRTAPLLSPDLFQSIKRTVGIYEKDHGKMEIPAQ